MLKTQDLDLSRVIRPGDRLMWGQSVAEPRSLIAKVIEQRARFGGIRVFLGIGSGDSLAPNTPTASDCCPIADQARTAGWPRLGSLISCRRITRSFRS